jgi:hypothetical protein
MTPVPRTTRPVLAPAYYLGRPATWWIGSTAAPRGHARPRRHLAVVKAADHARARPEGMV